MQKQCTNCSATFEIVDDDLAFYDKVSPVFGGKKYQIPPPTHCPDCRQQRRLSHGNEFNLYQGTCDLCKKSMISEHSPEYPGPVYCRPCWNSDKWDPCAYGRDFDFNRPFFEQFHDLYMTVPATCLIQDGLLENSEYIHWAGTCKNSYLIMHADFCEDCYYGYGFKSNRSCADGFYNLHSELCYDCIDCHKCYDLIGSQDCINCHSSMFLRDCIGCKNCLLCSGLREQEYCIENKKVTKEEYEEALKKINTGSYSEYMNLKERRKEIDLLTPRKAIQGHNLVNCSGDHLVNSKDIYRSFDCEDVEGARYATQMVLGAKDVMDVWQYGNKGEIVYECACVGEGYNFLFCYQNWGGCSDLICCAVNEATQHCFGTVQTKRKKYCILNKQYTEEEYNELVPKIIEHMISTGEWGQLFPIKYSYFGYNESSANMYYPLSKEEAEAKGYKWCNYKIPEPDSTKVIQAHQLPDDIKDIPDDILNWAIVCEESGKQFKLTKQEFQYYKDRNLPVPRKQWYQRHLARFAQRNPRTLFDRSCDKCAKDIQTSYAPDRPEKVYCEECYLKEVY